MTRTPVCFIGSTSYSATPRLLFWEPTTVCPRITCSSTWTSFVSASPAVPSVPPSPSVWLLPLPFLIRLIQRDNHFLKNVRLKKIISYFLWEFNRYHKKWQNGPFNSANSVHQNWNSGNLARGRSPTQGRKMRMELDNRKKMAMLFYMMFGTNLLT